MPVAYALPRLRAPAARPGEPRGTGRNGGESSPTGSSAAGERYPFNLMLLAVGGIMQWLAMIAILVAQNVQGIVQDRQVQHLHDLGVTTHTLVVQNTRLTEAIHDHLIKPAA